jgi:hypothetical protein
LIHSYKASKNSHHFNQKFKMLAILTILLISTASARFRAVCKSALVENERVDPIVNYGDISGHAHTVVGGNAFSARSKGADMAGSTGTTCDITEDKSGYWVPSLYNQLPDGTFEAVPFMKINAYYMVDPGRHPDLPDPKAPPPGYEVLFGAPGEREPSDSVGYQCERIGGQKGKAGNKKFDGFPPADQECPALRADVSGPTCWNGKQVRNDIDHVSHTFVGPGNKACPSSHPIRIIKQKIESYWDLSKIALPRKLVWAHGDTTGYGYHGDFVNGWDQKVLEDAVKLCDIRDGLEKQFRDNSRCNLPQYEQSDDAQEAVAKAYRASLKSFGGKIVPDEECAGIIPELCGGASVSPIFGGFGRTPSQPSSPVYQAPKQYRSTAPTAQKLYTSSPAPTTRTASRKEVTKSHNQKCKGRYRR